MDTNTHRPGENVAAWVARKWQRWTPTEDKYLTDNYGRTSRVRMQEKLHRPWSGIRRRAVYLEIGKRSCDYGYHVSDVAMMLGRDRATVTGWVESRKMAAVRRQTEHPRDLWAVTAKAIRAFVLCYPYEVRPGVSYDNGAWALLVDIVANARHGAGEFGTEESGTRGPSAKGRAVNDDEDCDPGEDDDE